MPLIRNNPEGGEERNPGGTRKRQEGEGDGQTSDGNYK